MDQNELDALLGEQARYYRARAATYDLDMAWDSDDPELRELLAPVFDWFADLPIRGQVLELACGTGAWTRRLAARATHVHAVDVAPEMIRRARARLTGRHNVTFEVADLYDWRPSIGYDLVFFSFILTHVPDVMASRFWQQVSSCLADDGAVAFVDAAPDGHGEEEWLGDGVVQRTLRDGSVHRIVKVFPSPATVAAVMRDHGLTGTVDTTGTGFMIGVGTCSNQ